MKEALASEINDILKNHMPIAKKMSKAQEIINLMNVTRKYKVINNDKYKTTQRVVTKRSKRKIRCCGNARKSNRITLTIK